MIIESDNIRAEVERIAAAAGVTYTVTYLGQRKRDGWDCDEWACRLTKTYADNGYVIDTRTEDFEFFTGLGLRKKSAYRHLPGTPQPPHIADLLHSLILDSDASTQSFASWCDELGYDSDSRKALATYEACQRNTDKLHRIFDANDIAALQTALQDY